MYANRVNERLRGLLTPHSRDLRPAFSWTQAAVVDGEGGSGDAVAVGTEADGGNSLWDPPFAGAGAVPCAEGGAFGVGSPPSGGERDSSGESSGGSDSEEDAEEDEDDDDGSEEEEGEEGVDDDQEGLDDHIDRNRWECWEGL